jgi:hypothetical protein
VAFSLQHCGHLHAAVSLQHDFLDDSDTLPIACLLCILHINFCTFSQLDVVLPFFTMSFLHTGHLGVFIEKEVKELKSAVIAAAICTGGF